MEYKNNPEIIATFVSEVEGLLDSCYESLYEMDQGNHSQAVINTIRRHIHCLKGTSHLLGMNNTGNILHDLEDIMMEPEDISESALENTYRIFDEMRGLVNLIRERGEIMDSDYQNVIAEIRKLKVAAQARHKASGHKVYLEDLMEEESAENTVSRTVDPIPEPPAAPESEPLPEGPADSPGSSPSSLPDDETESLACHELSEAEISRQQAIVLSDAILADMAGQTLDVESNFDDEDENLPNQMELVMGYVEESEDRLEKAYNVLLEIDNGDQSNEKVALFKREIHSLKGAAYMVGLKVSSVILHRLEDVLVLMMENKLHWNNDLIDFFYLVIDKVKEISNFIKTNHQIKELEASEIVERLTALLKESAESGTENSQDTLTALNRPEPDSPAGPPPPASPASPAAPIPTDTIVKVKSEQPSLPAVQVVDSMTSGPIKTLRVNMDKIDANMNLVTELVISKIRFDERFRQMLNLTDGVERYIRDLTEISTQEDEFISFEVLEQKIRNQFFKVTIADRIQDPIHFLEEEILRLMEDYRRKLSRQGLTSILTEVKVITNELRNIILETENNSRELVNATDTIGLLTSSLHENLMRIRMLPISTLFNKFRRMVRDLAREYHKQIDFVVTGENTEMDKNVLEEIGDPIMHILRNCVDHGIEAPEARRSKGKSPVGTMSLSASYEGNQVVIEISDDGKGLDTARIKQKAILKGVITQDQANSMTQLDLQSLIFTPGFSTLDNPTAISGRGIGMDVVKNNISKLKGIIDIESTENMGTLFRIRLPLTLAVLQVLIVRCATEVFAIPLTYIEQTFSVYIRDIKTFGHEKTISLMGRTIPLKHLSELLDLEERSIGLSDSAQYTGIITRYGHQYYAFIIDELFGRQEIVIKSLGDYLMNVPHITGATILGNGSVVLILDVPSILNKAIKSSKLLAAAPATERKEESDGNSEAKGDLEEERPSDENSSVVVTNMDAATILIVDDSKTIRKTISRALNLAGYNTLEAEDGEEAISIANRIPIDFFTVDVDMPKMDGYTLTRNLRKIPRYLRTPIVMVTSKSGQVDKEKGLAAGADAYLTKPFDSKELVQFVLKRLK